MSFEEEMMKADRFWRRADQERLMDIQAKMVELLEAAGETTEGAAAAWSGLAVYIQDELKGVGGTAQEAHSHEGFQTGTCPACGMLLRLEDGLVPKHLVGQAGNVSKCEGSHGPALAEEGPSSPKIASRMPYRDLYLARRAAITDAALKDLADRLGTVADRLERLPVEDLEPCDDNPRAEIDDREGCSEEEFYDILRQAIDEDTENEAAQRMLAAWRSYLGILGPGLMSRLEMVKHLEMLLSARCIRAEKARDAEVVKKVESAVRLLASGDQYWDDAMCLLFPLMGRKWQDTGASKVSVLDVLACEPDGRLGTLSHNEIAAMVRDHMEKCGIDPARYDGDIYDFANGWNGGNDRERLTAAIHVLVCNLPEETP